MPNLPISGLPAGSALDGTELFAIVQDGVTKYTTLNAINTSTTSNYGLFNQTGSSSPVSGSATLVETSGSLLNGGVGSLDIPANGFQVGSAFQVKMAGKINIANNHTLDIQFKADGVTLVDTGNIVMAKSTNGQNWTLDITFIIQNIGSAGTASILSTGELTARKDAAGEIISEIFSSINNTTFDTTISNTLSVEAILGAACTASENIYSELFTLHKIY
jgi:hypothetical protein